MIEERERAYVSGEENAQERRREKINIGRKGTKVRHEKKDMSVVVHSYMLLPMDQSNSTITLLCKAQ